MICERCQNQVATIFMQQIVNGEKTEMHLCQECASQLDMPVSFDKIFQGFMDSVMYNNSPPALKCQSCGLTFDGFKSSGRMGCSDCYRTFANEIDTILKNVQGSNRHQGKFPHKFGAELLYKREVERLKTQLTKAVENEEYEEAAKLRDMIKELENGRGGEQS